MSDPELLLLLPFMWFAASLMGVVADCLKDYNQRTAQEKRERKEQRLMTKTEKWWAEEEALREKEYQEIMNDSS